MAVEDRAREWRRSVLAQFCDVLAPWEYGTVARCRRYPSFYEFNAVQVEREPAMDTDALIAFADAALAGLAHRRIDFELDTAAGPFRGEFEARGWRTFCLVRMRHEGESAGTTEPSHGVESVPYDAVAELRAAWHEEDFPGIHPGRYFDWLREVSQSRNVQVLAVRRGIIPIAYAEIEQHGDGAEVSAVYVRAEDRGQGIGTALTSAAVRAAPRVRDLWITADDEDRPKHLYARLGFRPIVRAVQFLRLPPRPSVMIRG
jgi:GNAT superfamily N-acetyltransferase